MTKNLNSNLYDKNYFYHCGGNLAFRRGKIEHSYFEAILKSGIKKGKPLVILDVGCGRGDLIKAMLIVGFGSSRFIGVDYSDAAVRIARNIEKENKNVKIIKCNVSFLPFKDKMFDFVFLLDVIEHLYPDHLDKVMKEIHRVMKVKGKLIIHTFPNKYMNNLAHFILQMQGKSSIGQKLHVNTQTYFSIRNILFGNSFENIQIFL